METENGPSETKTRIRMLERPYDILQTLDLFPWRSGSRPKAHGSLQILKTIIRKLIID